MGNPLNLQHVKKDIKNVRKLKAKPVTDILQRLVDKDQGPNITIACYERCDETPHITLELQTAMVID